MSDPTDFPRPNCERLSRRAKDTQVIKDFLDFCEESGVQLMESYREARIGIISTPISEGQLQDLMYQFIDVDPVELDNERRRLLDALAGGSP